MSSVPAPVVSTRNASAPSIHRPLPLKPAWVMSALSTVAVISLNAIASIFAYSIVNDCPPPMSTVSVRSPKVTALEAKPDRSMVLKPP